MNTVKFLGAVEKETTKLLEQQAESIAKGSIQMATAQTGALIALAAMARSVVEAVKDEG